MATEIAYVRKYRPVTFKDYMGKDTKNLVMSRMSDEKNYPQVWLFYGERGCGKTSAARLLAPEYLCVTKVDGHACGTCEICTSLQDMLINADAGSIAYGVTELNIASDSGKAAINDVIEDALQAPQLPLKYKVLIFDECHMATKPAQSLLLKIVEEPPKHLIIIFCTTDKDKMLETLLDRCQVKIHVKKASQDDLIERLLYICKQENITTSTEALRLIVRKCERNPRKSIMKLEEIAKGNNYIVNIQAVHQYTDNIDSNLYLNYIKSSTKNLEAIIEYTSELKEKEIELREFINGLSRFILDCIHIKFALNLEEYSIEFVKAVKQIFKEYTSDEFDTALQIVEDANKSITYNTSSEFAELTICTTALRLGKIKVLSQGLQNELNVAIQETKRGNKKAIENKKAEAKEDTTLKVEANEETLQSVFGHSIVEVKATEVKFSGRDEEPLSVDSQDPSSETEFDKLLKELNM